MNRAANYISIAKKAGLIELGEANTGAAAREGKARLVILASDASANAADRARGFQSRKLPVPPGKATAAWRHLRTSVSRPASPRRSGIRPNGQNAPGSFRKGSKGPNGEGHSAAARRNGMKQGKRRTNV